MVEPTETETKESLDAFAEAIEQILAEAEADPEIAKQRPLHDPGPPPRRGRGQPVDPRRPPAARLSGSRAGRSRAPAAPAPAPAPGRRGRRAARSAPARRRPRRPGVEPSPLSATASTSSQVTGVEAVGRSRARSE